MQHNTDSIVECIGRYIVCSEIHSKNMKMAVTRKRKGSQADRGDKLVRVSTQSLPENAVHGDMYH